MADRFQELLDAWVDGTLSDEQFAQLERRISEDASLRRRFLDYQSLRADLEEKAIQEGLFAEEDCPFPSLTNEISNEGFLHDASSTALPKRDRKRSGHRRLPWYARTTVAVLALASIGLALWAYWGRDARDPSGGPPASVVARRPSEEEQPVARLIEGIDFAFADREIILGEGLSSGFYHLERGKIGMKFRNGVEMSLSGPAKFDVVSDMRVALHEGNAWANVPKSGHGFRVVTPEFDVEDQGTEFGVIVEPDLRAQVHVFGGKVMVHRAGQLVQAMEEGEAATWENRDEVSLGSADQGKFRTRIEIGYDRYRQFSEQLRADPATVFFYDFEMDATAADILRDRAANGGEKIDGKLRDCIWVSGRWRDKGALLFDRDEAAVQLDFPDGRNKFDVFTMSAWVQIAPADIAYQTLFDSCKFYEKGFFNWRVGRAGTIVSGVRRCFEVTSPEGTVPFSRWGHHAVVVNSTTGTAEYFLDGQVVEQVEWRGKTRLKFGECLIGLYVPHVPREWTFASELHGRIDEFAMFSREFSHREIKAIYDAGKGFE